MVFTETTHPRRQYFSPATWELRLILFTIRSRIFEKYILNRGQPRGLPLIILGYWRSQRAISAASTRPDRENCLGTAAAKITKKNPIFENDQILNDQSTADPRCLIQSDYFEITF